VLAHALAYADMAREHAEDEEYAEHGEQRQERQQQRLGGRGGDKAQHNSPGSDRGEDDGDQPIVAGSIAKDIVTREHGFGFGDVALAHEGESYLILGGDRAEGLHVYSGTRTLRYSTLGNGTQKGDICVKNTAGSSARACRSSGCTDS